MAADPTLPPATARRRKRRWPKVVLGVALALLLSGALVWRMMIQMPGESFRGPLEQLSAPTASLRDELAGDVEQLAGAIGERNLEHYPRLVQAAEYVEAELHRAGYEVRRQEYTVRDMNCWNLEVELPGGTRSDEIVVVGAHYDTYFGTPGANDNASGTAALLALARRFASARPARTLRFVAFTNEEPPYFQNEQMGSWQYAARCARREENLACVLSLETIGYYSDEPGSQAYPPPFGVFYPSQGDFIAVVGNVGSRKLVRQIVATFRRHGEFPSEGGAVPSFIPGAGWSDHWSFWQFGYSAAMITDTAPFRYPYYHEPNDTPRQCNFDHMARVVSGVEHVVAEFAGVRGDTAN